MTNSRTKQILTLYWFHVSRYPKIIAGIFISVPVTVFVYNFIPPLIIADIINKLSKGHVQSSQIWHDFGWLMVLYILLVTIGGVVLWRIVDAFVWHLEASVDRDIARRVYKHMIHETANFHANHFSGSMVSQTNKLISSYVRFQDTTVYGVYPLIVGLIFTSFILLSRAPVFVLVLIIFSISFLYLSFIWSRGVRDKTAITARAENRETGYLADSVSNVLALKSFAGEEYEMEEFGKVTQAVYDATLDTMHASRRQMVYISGATGAISAVALVMSVIGGVVLKENLATVYLILSYTSSIAGQLITFGNSSLRNYNRSLGDASEMTGILQEIPEVLDPPEAEKLKIKGGVIDFKNVEFIHEGADDSLFHNFSMHVSAGEKVGLVGHSGSGKSTFTRLLLRFSDVDGGEILIDGQNIANLKQADLRSKIAYVPQEPIMFHRTLAENISYGKFGATQKEIETAAKSAHADEFIGQLTKGYKSLVGERGIKLSGGQRQRIAIARAILKNAPILILDEATSSLDSESEVLIQDALWKLMQGRTAIVIAHRLSTIQKMDRIVVLDDGRIIEQGTHKELLDLDGSYAKLWAHQSGGFVA